MTTLPSHMKDYYKAKLEKSKIKYDRVYILLCKSVDRPRRHRRLLHIENSINNLCINLKKRLGILVELTPKERKKYSNRTLQDYRI